MITTLEAALDALQSALADVDRQVAAARALGRVVGQFSPAAPSFWYADRTYWWILPRDLIGVIG